MTSSSPQGVALLLVLSLANGAPPPPVPTAPVAIISPGSAPALEATSARPSASTAAPPAPGRGAAASTAASEPPAPQGPALKAPVGSLRTGHLVVAAADDAGWTWARHLLAGLSFATAVKAMCMAGNVLVQLSPYPQVQRWEQRKDTGEADAAPYVSIAFGGWQWCYYGFFAYLETQRSGFLILVHSNCLGALLGTYYTMAFYRHCQCQGATRMFYRYLSAVASLALFQVCAVLVLPAVKALFLTGLVSSFCSFVGACSMLVTVPTVLRTGDSRAIPGPIVLANLLSALVWIVCGWMLADPLIATPNTVSALASLTCIYLKLQYPSGPDGAFFPSEDKEAASEAAATLVKFPECEKGAQKKADMFTESTPLQKAAFVPKAFSDDTGGTF